MKGILILDKPKGMSSSKAVSKVKHIVGGKVGHMGTLDPLASGVLPICIGKATKLFDYFLSKTKIYIAEYTFGYTTDTLDSEGVVISTSDIIPSVEQLVAECKAMTGESMQVPPMYSAKSVDGVRAYDLARKGIQIELKPKAINIYKFNLIEANAPKFLFEIECSSGTYIRSICRDLAARLGVDATMTALRRVRCGVFDISESVPVEDLTKQLIIDNLINIDDVIDLDVLELDDDMYYKFINGQQMRHSEDGEYKLKYDGDVVAIAEVSNGIIRIKTNLRE